VKMTIYTDSDQVRVYGDGKGFSLDTTTDEPNALVDAARSMEALLTGSSPARPSGESDS
jgi:hypothetical protein